MATALICRARSSVAELPRGFVFKRRKKLTDHPIAPWELRVGDFRVFYDIEDEMVVKITAIGHKVHSDLFVRGKKVEL